MYIFNMEKIYEKNIYGIPVLKACLTCQFRGDISNGCYTCIAHNKGVGRYDCCDGYLLREKYQNAGKGDGVVTPKTEIIMKQLKKEEKHNALLHKEKEHQENCKE